MMATPLEREMPQPANEARAGRRLMPLLVIVASVGYLCRVDVTALAPHLMAELRLTQQQMGEVFTAFLIGYTAFQIPSGWLADRISTRSLYLALLLAWAVLTLGGVAVGWPLLGMTLGGLPALLALRAALGIFAAPTYPAAGRAIAVLIPARLQGRANGAVLASIGIGSAVTPPLLGFVAAHWGWRMGFAVAAALSAGVCLLWQRAAPRHSSPRAAAPSAARNSLSASAREARNPASTSSETPLRQRSFWFLAASYTLQGYVGYIFVFWFYLYLVQVRHFELLKAAWLTTLPWLSTLAAIPAGGWVSDLAVKRWGTTWGRRSLPLIALLFSAGWLALGAHTGSAALAVVSLTAATALVLASEGPYWAAMNQLCGSRSGTGGGVMNFGSNVGGMISPVATPWLAARLGWESALLLTAGVALLAGLLWMGVEGRKEVDSGP